MKSFSIIILIVSYLNFGLIAQERKPQANEGWKFSLGAGAIYSPKYLGDDDYKLSAYPTFEISYADDFYASVQDGLRYNIINKEGFKFGPVVKYNFGRDDDGSSSFSLSSDTDDLRGLGDVDSSLEVGAYASYDFRSFKFKLEMLHGLGGGHEGLLGEFSVRYKGMASFSGKRIIYTIGPHVKFTDEDYNESYFGVDAQQSAASGLAQYNADSSTFSYGLGATVIIPWTDRISTVLLLSYNILGDTIEDSSLVRERGSEDQFSVGFFINYTF